MFYFVTEERAAAGRIVREVLSPTLNRPEEELSQRLLVGPAGKSHHRNPTLDDQPTIIARSSMRISGCFAPECRGVTSLSAMVPGRRLLADSTAGSGPRSGSGFCNGCSRVPRRRLDVHIQTEQIRRVVAVLECDQPLPVLRRVGGARPLRIAVAQDEEVDEGGGLSCGPFLANGREVSTSSQLGIYEMRFFCFQPHDGSVGGLAQQCSFEA
jgi:hypothetical protein